MNSTNYAEQIFGGVIEAKKLYVEELKCSLREKMMLPADLDRMIGLSSEWPSTMEILNDPGLFTLYYLTLLGVLYADGADEDLFCLEGRLLAEKIDAYIDQPGMQDRIIAEFQSVATIVDVTLIVDGEVREGSPNHISPREHAQDHVYSCILQEIGNSVT